MRVTRACAGAVSSSNAASQLAVRFILVLPRASKTFRPQGRSTRRSCELGLARFYYVDRVVSRADPTCGAGIFRAPRRRAIRPQGLGGSQEGPHERYPGNARRPHRRAAAGMAALSLARRLPGRVRHRRPRRRPHPCGDRDPGADGDGAAWRLPAAVGLVVLIAAAIAFAAFGGSRFVSCGADSTITPIFAGGLAMTAAVGSADYFVLAAALALMVGLMLVAAGLFRLGWVADLLSIPVTTGFLPGVLGVPAPEGVTLQRLAALVGELGRTNPYTLAIGAGVLAAILVSERIDGRIPGALIGLVAATVAVIAFGLEGRGVAVLGEVAGGLPVPSLPAVSVARLVEIGRAHV